MSIVHQWHSDEPLPLASGEELGEVVLSYTTLGTLAADGANVVWIFHPLTCSSNVTEWWPEIVGAGRLLDPAHFFIVCVDSPGSCHGSTGPQSTMPGQERRYGLRFPDLSMRDVVGCYDRLRRTLGIDRILLGIGGSYGGQQLFEWLAQAPDLFDLACVIGASDAQSPWAIAFNETQRMALRADPGFGQEYDGAGQRGLAAARALAVLSYRSSRLYADTQSGRVTGQAGYRAAAYQQHVGARFTRRFDACSYWALTRIMDSHDVLRHRGTRDSVLGRIRTHCLLIALRDDVLFPVDEVFSPEAALPHVACHVLECDHGHDSILTHQMDIAAQVSRVLAPLAVLRRLRTLLHEIPA